MPVRPRNRPAPTEDVPSVPVTNLAPVTPPRLVTQIMTAFDGQEEHIREIRIEMKETLDDAVTRQHLHTAAFRDIRRLNKLTPAQLHDWRYHFDHLWEASGLKAKAESAPRLALDDPTHTNGTTTPPRARPPVLAISASTLQTDQPRGTA